MKLQMLPKLATAYCLTIKIYYSIQLVLQCNESVFPLQLIQYLFMNVLFPQIGSLEKVKLILKKSTLILGSWLKWKLWQVFKCILIRIAWDEQCNRKWENMRNMKKWNNNQSIVPITYVGSIISVVYSIWNIHQKINWKV